MLGFALECGCRSGIGSVDPAVCSWDATEVTRTSNARERMGRMHALSLFRKKEREVQQGWVWRRPLNILAWPLAD